MELFFGKTFDRFFPTYFIEKLEVYTMKCYQCAKEGVETEAVVICIICGMGLCMDHLFREELLVTDIVDWGLGGEKIEYQRTLPRFICEDCKVAMEQRGRG